MAPQGGRCFVTVHSIFDAADKTARDQIWGVHPAQAGRRMTATLHESVVSELFSSATILAGRAREFPCT